MPSGTALWEEAARQEGSNGVPDPETGMPTLAGHQAACTGTCLSKKRSLMRPAWQWLGLAVLGLLNRRPIMSKLTALIGFIFLSVSSVWAQTPPYTRRSSGRRCRSRRWRDHGLLVGDPADHHCHRSHLVLLAARQKHVAGPAPERDHGIKRSSAAVLMFLTVPSTGTRLTGRVLFCLGLTSADYEQILVANRAT